MIVKFIEGHLYISVPPTRDTPWRLGPDGRGGWRRIDQARTFKRATVVLAPPRSGARRPPVPRPIVHAMPRPREGGARMVAASGRDGDGARDNGSGDSDGDGGGDGDGPSPTPAREVVGGAS